MERMKDIFKEVKSRRMENERKKKALLSSTRKLTVVTTILLLLILAAALPSVSASSSEWIHDGSDSSGDHVVAGSYYNMPQKNTNDARAFIKVEAKYTASYQWWGIQYKVPTNIDVRIYMDKGVDYLYVDSNKDGHYCISDAWSNPKDTWNVGGITVGFGPYSATLPSFYSVDNIMLNSQNHGHWGYGGDVKWYFSTYNVGAAIDSFMGSEKWFGGDQGYYFIGGNGATVTYHFHTGVNYATYVAPYWNPLAINYTGHSWVSSNVYAYDGANIRIGS